MIIIVNLKMMMMMMVMLIVLVKGIHLIYLPFTIIYTENVMTLCNNI